jgi:hypothetical protein
MHVLLNTRYAQGTKNTKLGALCALVFIGCGYAALRILWLHSGPAMSSSPAP